jgi:hypothetical protein
MTRALIGLFCGVVFLTPSAFAQNAYTGLAIVQPAGEETLHSNEGRLLVQVDVEPALADGDELVVLLDGEPVARAAITTFEFAGVERGEHEVEVQIVDANGNAVVASQPVTFYMWQASRLFPSRRSAR